MWLIQFLDKMGKRLCNSDFSVLPMPLVWSVKNQSKIPETFLVGGQCFDRVMLYLNHLTLMVLL